MRMRVPLNFGDAMHGAGWVLKCTELSCAELNCAVLYCTELCCTAAVKKRHKSHLFLFFKNLSIFNKYIRQIHIP